MRNYIVGDSQRHIDWKAVARGQPMMVKQFETISQREIWLSTDTLRSLNIEKQLSQLARWIMHCERVGLRYGLQIGGIRIAAGQGATHYHRCLRELAAHPGDGKKGQG